MPCVWRDNHGGSSDQQVSDAGVSRLSYMAVLQGGRSEGVERPRDREPSEITIFGDSAGVDRLKLSCVLEWSFGSGIDVTSLLSEVGVEVSVVKIDRCKCLLVFDREESFTKVSSLAASWWSGRGVSLLPWTEDLVLRPMREAWVKCLGVPIHASLPSWRLESNGAREDPWIYGSLPAAGRTPGAAMVTGEIEHRAGEEDHRVPIPVVPSASSDGDNAEGDSSRLDQLT
ncbi:hypothetical protein Dimus_006966 [Dionaea muscipula]